MDSHTKEKPDHSPYLHENIVSPLMVEGHMTSDVESTISSPISHDINKPSMPQEAIVSLGFISVNFPLDPLENSPTYQHHFYLNRHIASDVIPLSKDYLSLLLNLRKLMIGTIHCYKT